MRVIEEGKQLLPVEIKSSQTFNTDLLAGLYQWTRLAGTAALQRKLTAATGRFLEVHLQLLGLDFSSIHHYLKHPVNYAPLEVHMLIQAGAESVDESHCADGQGCLIHLGRTRAVCLQALRNDPQKMRSAMFSAAPSRCMKYRSRLGTDSTHQRTGMYGKTWSARCAVVSTMRRVLQNEQAPRPLQTKARK